MTATTPSGCRIVLQNQFNHLGSRLVRFGQAMQEPSTTVSELMQLAHACGINLKLRMAVESEGRSDG